ncbi:MAG: type II toxin-antitoxin system VapC family toxin [Sulfuricaulis sp.]|uniref:type II toxin-antitoxin system VapC family toxin n=1 Tax=Sulfuricaulis sp. TaxID=2003553 RepID=UPI0034A3510E
MRFLLDTCTFLWMVSDQARLSEACRNNLVDPANEVLLSSVSAWEICIKHKLGGLTLSEAPQQFVPKFRAMHGVSELALDEPSVLQLPRLPDIHKDPFDRVLVCQAIEHGLTILTPDPLITQYPVRTAW